MSVGLNYAARSDVGLVRSSNQDSGYAGPHLLVLADGMGGAAGGDIASSIAVAHLAPLDGESHGGDDLLDQLRHAVLAAHDDLVAYSQDQPDAAGLGTTVIALLRSGSKLGMVHVGDSRAYLLREGAVSQVTEDHSLVGHLVSTGQITEEEAEHHPQRSVLLRVLGDDPEAPELDESIREARHGDRWLLCSDGLSSYVSYETIVEALHTRSEPGDCAEHLIQLALRAGGPDNVTVVVADVVQAGDLPETAPQIVGSAATDRSRPTRGGGGAAARAAALTQSPEEEREQPSEVDLAELERRPRPWRRVLRWFIGLVVALALILGIGAVGYRWSQSQYFVGTDGTHVVIYQGVPQSLGPLNLSRVQEVTDVETAGLPPYVQSRLEDHIAADDLGDAENIVRRLSEQGGTHQDEEDSSNPGNSSNSDNSGNSDKSGQSDTSSQSGTSAQSGTFDQPIDTTAAGPTGGEI